jgi:hypothetical protein
MRLRSNLSSSVFSSVLMNWVAGFVTEIDFDSVASGTVVNNAYRGVALNAVPLKNPTPGAGFGSVYASNGADPGNQDSPPNVVTINKPPQAAGFNDSVGGIQVTFTSPQLYVSIDTRAIVTAADPRNPNSNAPYMEIYGVPIQLIPPAHLPPALIATVSLAPLAANPNFESWQTLDFVSTSPTPNIGSIIFSCSSSGAVGASVYALFDRLRFAHHLPLTATFKEG